MESRFSRSCALIGKENTDILKNSAVAVFGIGGVGSYAALSLARSGIGTVYLYDCDSVSESNINRQLIAFDSTVGNLKTDVAKQMMLDINPDIKVFCDNGFISEKSEIPFEKFDFIIDAVDNVTAKLFLIENAKKKDVPIISIMGTGNKLCPEKLRIDKIEDTKGCPLSRVMRYELKKRGIKDVMAVWSEETPVKPDTLPDTDFGAHKPASMAFVPGAAGLFAASYVIRKFINF